MTWNNQMVTTRCPDISDQTTIIHSSFVLSKVHSSFVLSKVDTEKGFSVPTRGDHTINSEAIWWCKYYYHRTVIMKNSVNCEHLTKHKWWPIYPCSICLNLNQNWKHSNDQLIAAISSCLMQNGTPGAVRCLLILISRFINQPATCWNNLVMNITGLIWISELQFQTDPE